MHYVKARSLAEALMRFRRAGVAERAMEAEEKWQPNVDFMY